MAFRALATPRLCFLPRKESERWPNTPPPEITNKNLSYKPFIILKEIGRNK